MNVKKIYFIVIVILVFIFGAWLLCRIHNNGDAIQSTYEQSERIRDHQSEVIGQLSNIQHGIDSAIERVEQAEERVDRITESAIRIQERNSVIYESVRESQQRIADSKRILEEIGKTKK